MKPSKNNGERSVFDVKASGARHHPQRKFIKRFFYDRNVLNLRPHLIFRRPVAWVLGVLVLLLGIFFIVHNRATKADVKDFYPSTCLGDWQWATNAQGKPDTLTAPSSSFSPANSAMYDATGTEIYCGGFLPSDYDGTGTITSVGVTLVWQVGDGVAILPSSSTPSTDVSGGDGGGSESDASSTLASSTTPNTTSTTTDVVSSTTTSSASSTDAVASSTPDENTSSTAPLATTTVATTTSNTAASTTTSTTTSTTITGTDTNTDASTTDVTSPPPSAPTSTPAPAPADTSGDTSASSSAMLFVRSLFASLVHPAFADDTSTAGTVISAPPTIVSSTLGAASTTLDIASGTASSTDDIASDTLPVAPPVPDDNFLEVSYSTDGQTWIPLRGVNMSNWPNLTLAIPVSQWSDLQNLQVRIDDMPSTQSPIPTVFLDGMFVEVQYDVAAPDDGGPAPIYTDFTTDKTTYTQGDLAEVTGAPAESAIEIYSLDVLDSPGQPSHVYGTRLDNTGGTEIDTNTLPPGHYALVNTFEPGTCNQYSLSDCEARTDFISEEDITVLPPAPASQ